jgi:hypothetical protein
MSSVLSKFFRKIDNKLLPRLSSCPTLLAAWKTGPLKRPQTGFKGGLIL